MSGPADTLVIGIGNDDRGDDACGLRTVRALAPLVPDGVRLIEHEGDALDLIESWAGAARVFLVDAVVTGAAPGTVVCLDAAREPLPYDGFRIGSSHALGVGEAVELARTLGRLPRACTLYGIEGSRFEPGATPAPEVEAATGVVVRALLSEVGTRDADGH